MEPEFAHHVWLLEKGVLRRDSRGYTFCDAIHPEIVGRYISSPCQAILSFHPSLGLVPLLLWPGLLRTRYIGYEIDTDLRPLIEESIKSPQHFPSYNKLLNRTREARSFSIR